MVEDTKGVPVVVTRRSDCADQCHGGSGKERIMEVSGGRFQEYNLAEQ